MCLTCASGDGRSESGYDRDANLRENQAIVVNGVGDAKTGCGDGCTLYGPDTRAPVMTWIHAGGHVYPGETAERIVSFFRIHSRTR